MLHISSKLWQISLITFILLSNKHTHRDHAYYNEFQTQDNQDVNLQLISICVHNLQKSIITSSMFRQLCWHSWSQQYIYVHGKIPNQLNDHIRRMTDRMYYSDHRCHSFDIPQIARTLAPSNSSTTDNIMYPTSHRLRNNASGHTDHTRLQRML